VHYYAYRCYDRWGSSSDTSYDDLSSSPRQRSRDKNNKYSYRFDSDSSDYDEYENYHLLSRSLKTENNEINYLSDTISKKPATHNKNK
jgi:hypothetical protein